MSSALAASMIFLRNAEANGESCCVVLPTKKTDSTPSTLRRTSSLTKPCWHNFRKATVTFAYLQTKIGYKVKRDMPGLDGPNLDALYAKGEAWLKGRRL